MRPLKKNREAPLPVSGSFDPTVPFTTFEKDPTPCSITWAFPKSRQPTGRKICCHERPASDMPSTEGTMLLSRTLVKPKFHKMAVFCLKFFFIAHSDRNSKIFFMKLFVQTTSYLDDIVISQALPCRPVRFLEDGSAGKERSAPVPLPPSRRTPRPFPRPHCPSLHDRRS